MQSSDDGEFLTAGCLRDSVPPRPRWGTERDGLDERRRHFLW